MADDQGSQLGTVRHLVDTATQRLLGDTIEVTDEQWREPSRLPDWSRGHVASHLARHAEATARLCDGARSGEPVQMYASPQARADGIEQGAGRSGLDLQIDLDTTAGRLDEAFDALTEADAWGSTVTMRGDFVVPARLLPLARLTEVVLHHVDLDVGFGIDDVDEETTGWLLEWLSVRLRDSGLPALRLVADHGTEVHFGPAEEATEVRGPGRRLLGWLTGRAGSDGLTGAEGIELPAF